MIYIQCTRHGGTTYMAWDGQTQDQVAAMLSALGATNVQYIDEATYQAATQR